MNVQAQELSLFGWNQFIRTDEKLTRIIYLDGDEYESTVDTTGVYRGETDELANWWYAYLKGEKPVARDSRGALRVAELFCGSGGLAQGVKQFCREAGYEFFSVGAIDEDGSAVDVYAQNHGTDPDRAIKGQVSALVDFAVRGIAEDARWSNQPEMIDDRWATLTDTDAVDVLLAGPPCQGHSNLNNHTRRNDRRNEDYLYVPAVACALDIPVVIIENVPAVIHDHGSVVDTAKQLFLEAGYRVETGVFKAGAMGWPQNRSRFFLIACKHTSPAYLHHVAEALALPKGRPPLSVMWAIGDFEDADPDEHHMYRQAAYTQDNLARIAYLHDEDVFDLPVELHNEKHREGTSYTSVYGRMYGDRPAGTITTGFLTPGRGRYVHPTRRRTLNPREAARLQGFPDTYRFLLDGKPPPSGQLTKWIGDAVPMPLGYAAAISALSAGLPQR